MFHFTKQPLSFFPMIPRKYPLGITSNYFEIKFHAALILGKETPLLPHSAKDFGYQNLPHSAGPYSGNGHCLRLLPHTKLFKNHEPKVL
jgi:hypothetical protein